MKIIIFIQDRLLFFSEGRIEGLNYHIIKNKALPRSVEDISTHKHLILFFFLFFLPNFRIHTNSKVYKRNKQKIQLNQIR